MTTVLLLALNSTASAADPPLRLALIIGNNHHLEDPARDLSFADDDAIEAARRLLWVDSDTRIWLLIEPDEQTRRAGIDEEAAEVLPPTRAGWDEALVQLRNQVTRYRGQSNGQVSLTVHFAGHGEPGGKLHLADQYLSKEDFLEGLDSIGADVVFTLLDGCYLADVSRGEGTAPATSAGIFDTGEIKVRGQPERLCLIGSSTAVSESQDLGGGLLTAIGMGGLLGPADLDSNQRITCEEWGEYVARHLELLQGAPTIEVSMRQGVRSATVVDLRVSRSGGIRIAQGFPEGEVRLLQSRHRTLILAGYHHGDRPENIRLGPGTYLVMRILSRDGWEGPGYPAEEWTVQVKGEVVPLEAGQVGRRVVLWPESLRGSATQPPQGYDIVPISQREERTLVMRAASRTVLRLPSPWRFHAALFAPAMGPDFKGPDESGERAPRPGGMVGASRYFPVWNRGPWFLATGPSLAYALRFQPLWLGDGDDASEVVLPRHELRIGLEVEELWATRGLAVSIRESAGYAPGLFTQGAGLPQPSSDYRYLFNTFASVAASIRLPVASRQTLGPFVQLELEGFRIPSPTSGVRAASNPQVSILAGIELQGKPFRR